MSTLRRKTAGYPKDTEGKILCRCGCGRYPEHPRINWFSQKCVDSYMSKTDTATIRKLLKIRDKGICAICRIDADAEFTKDREAYRQASRTLGAWESVELKRIRKDGKHQGLRNGGMEILWPDCINRRGWLDFNKYKPAYRAEVFKLAGIEDRKWYFDRRSGWDADHIIPVCEGGGECGMDNYRTLCHRCHKRVTGELAARRNSTRAHKP